MVYQVIVLAIMLVLGGFGAARWHYKPKLDAAVAKVDLLARDVTDQNDALEALREAADKRSAEAAKAVAAARRQANLHTQRAGELLAIQPAGEECEAIGKLLDEGLAE